ncbi:hypothetical protein CBL_05411 [Carabus blaptoides fortunei]
MGETKKETGRENARAKNRAGWNTKAARRTRRRRPTAKNEWFEGDVRMKRCGQKEGLGSVGGWQNSALALSSDSLATRNINIQAQRGDIKASQIRHNGFTAASLTLRSFSLTCCEGCLLLILAMLLLQMERNGRLGPVDATDDASWTRSSGRRWPVDDETSGVCTLLQFSSGCLRLHRSSLRVAVDLTDRPDRRLLSSTGGALRRSVSTRADVRSDACAARRRRRACASPFTYTRTATLAHATTTVLASSSLVHFALTIALYVSVRPPRAHLTLTDGVVHKSRHFLFQCAMRCSSKKFHVINPPGELFPLRFIHRGRTLSFRTIVALYTPANFRFKFASRTFRPDLASAFGVVPRDRSVHPVQGQLSGAGGYCHESGQLTLYHMDYSNEREVEGTVTKDPWNARVTLSLQSQLHNLLICIMHIQ